MSRFQSFLRLGLLAGALAGCGGGGASVGPPAAADLQYLAFVSGVGELKLFDPETGVTLPNIDSGLDVQRGQSAFRMILGGSYRSTDNTLADPRHLAVVYLKQGQVFRLSLSKVVPSDTPTPIRVSSVADACAISDRQYDFANPEQTRLLLTTAGADANCAVTGDNSGRYIALGDDELTPGTDVTPATFLVGGSLRDDDGSLQYVLVQEGPTSAPLLRRYNANLQSTQLIAELEPSTSVDFGGPAPSGEIRYLRLRVKGAPFTCLHRYTASSNSLSDCLHTDPTQPLSQTSEADPSYIYYASGNMVYRMLHAGTSPTPIRNAGADVAIRNLRLSSDRVVLNGINNTTAPPRYHLETFPRTGGTVVTLKSDSANALSISAVADNRIYFQDDQAAVATAVLDDGRGLTSVGGARWSGFSQATGRISIGGTEIFLDSYHGLLGRFTGNNVMTFSSLSADTGSGIVTVGTITGGIRSTTSSLGRYRLMAVTVFRTSPNTTIDTDIYFADTRSTNSLQPLATTAGSNDWLFL